jgi:polysaccharide biosynthesis protein PslH
MRVLFVTSKSPLPINEGHALRSFNLLKAITQKHQVTLLSCVKFPVEYQFKNELEQYCQSVQQFRVPENCSAFGAGISAALNLCEKRPYVARKYHLPALAQQIHRSLSDGAYDLVHLDMLPLGTYLDSIHIPTLLNAHNIESDLLRRRAEATSNPIIRAYLMAQRRRLVGFETSVASRVNHVIACSDEDKQALTRMTHLQNITVVPNGVDVGVYAPSGKVNEAASKIVFIGGMNWFPNRDALTWFDAEILPLILKRLPECNLDVLGRSDSRVAIQHHAQVAMHGFVDDTRPYLERASVVAVPIRVGGGTRLKVLEAMSMGKALVSTTVGVEGIRVEHQRHLLVADSPAAFADSVVRLENDPALRKRLGTAARDLVASEYNWESIGRLLLRAYDLATS